MNKKLILFSLFLCFIVSTVAVAQFVIPWNEADKHYGEYAIVEGTIVATYNSGKACFLNFHPDYKRYFSAVIFKADFPQFPPDPEDYYYGKKVRVRGIIKEYQGKPEIILKTPTQIEVVETPLTEKKKSVPIVSWEDADKYYGQEVIVEGRIVATYNSGKACFLNFHKNWKRYFTAVIFASDFSKFPPNPEEYYRDKKVRIKGLVKEYQGKPEIILKSPKQIEIVEALKENEK